jgi:hypothetical protein
MSMGTGRVGGLTRDFYPELLETTNTEMKRTIPDITTKNYNCF